MHKVYFIWLVSVHWYILSRFLGCYVVILKYVKSVRSLGVSAPAKVILHGEHSVVYGKVSLAASIDLRTTLTWEELTNDTVELHLHDLGFSSTWTINQIEKVQLSSSVHADAFKTFLGFEDLPDVASSAVKAFVYLYRLIYGDSLLPGKFSLRSDIPVGAGLGSSASYCTVLATAMLITSGVFEPSSVSRSEALFNDRKTSRDECLRMISDWAYKAEMIIHGKPSGIDNTVSTFGGFVQFQAGELTNIERFPELNIFLINTNVPRSTKTMVSGLKQRYDKMPEVYDHLFSAISEISVECRRILERIGEQNVAKGTDCQNESDDFAKLEELIDLNQNILQTLGVSHATIDKVCTTTLTYGLHSKLTGAGGGGCVITLLKQDLESDTVDKLTEELKDLGCSCWKTKLGAEGVSVQNWTVHKNTKS